jgi:hypothetical protein
MKHFPPALAVTAAALAIGAPAAADNQKTPGDASIPFVNHGGIRDWRAIDDVTVYVQAQNGKWYLAKTRSDCLHMTYADDIGFDTGPVDTLDKFSTIIVQGQRCALKSLTRIDGRPPPSKPHSN